MTTKNLAKPGAFIMPPVMDDLFQPWNEWFGINLMPDIIPFTMPAVNIIENKDEYTLALAIPGVRKENLHINVEGDMLTVSAEKEETREEKDQKFTREEYNYSSFSRTFTIPEQVNKENIDARYENGILNLYLPKKEAFKNSRTGKHIEVK